MAEEARRRRVDDLKSLKIASFDKSAILLPLLSKQSSPEKPKNPQKIITRRRTCHREES
jgi:hypothetical protein